MPRAGSEGFVKPGSGELSEWRSLVSRLGTGDFEGTRELLAAGTLPYTLEKFHEAGLEGRILWALEEIPTSRWGWGSLYVNPAPRSDLGIEAPHPLFDAGTEMEAAEIFLASDARFLLVAGTHRCANAEASPCGGSSAACGDGRFHVSDAGHVTASLFEAAHEALTGRFPGLLVVSLHGNADSACEDVFLSSGAAGAPSPLLVALRDRLVAGEKLTVGLSGEPRSNCPLSGTTNVQGRFTNGSTDACASAAAVASGHFIHVEQKISVRTESALFGRLAAALVAIAPRLTSRSDRPR